jgi:hypothetical protein
VELEREPSDQPEAARRRLDLRRASGEVMRHWDSLQDRVPAPLLRILVTLPWLLRRMPVPFWVPLVLMLLRRLHRRRQRRLDRIDPHRNDRR